MDLVLIDREHVVVILVFALCILLLFLALLGNTLTFLSLVCFFDGFIDFHPSSIKLLTIEIFLSLDRRPHQTKLFAVLVVGARRASTWTSSSHLNIGERPH